MTHRFPLSCFTLNISRWGLKIAVISLTSDSHWYTTCFQCPACLFPVLPDTCENGPSSCCCCCVCPEGRNFKARNLSSDTRHWRRPVPRSAVTPRHQVSSPALSRFFPETQLQHLNTNKFSGEKGSQTLHMCQQSICERRYILENVPTFALSTTIIPFFSFDILTYIETSNIHLDSENCTLALWHHILCMIQRNIHLFNKEVTSCGKQEVWI